MRFKPWPHISRLLSLLLAWAVMTTPGLLAQSSGTGALTGTVTDPSGAVVPNVTVTLTNNDTGQVRTITTGSDGTYRFPLIPPGTYRVRFMAAGFKLAEVPTVTVNVSETPVLNQTLAVGQQAEAIEVQAEAAVLQTADSTLGTVVSGNSITEMPLASRNFTQILGMEAGAANGVNNGAAFGKATLDFSVNGAFTKENNFQMDGASVLSAWGTGIAADSGIYVGIPIPQPDAIAEFKVQTSTYDASYGRNPGANVNLVTKSGTNQFHGSAFEFFRNEDLNANSFFQNLYGGGRQQILKQNQFGGTAGGPVKKDKLFFFGGYQGTRQRNGVAAQGTSSTILPPIPGGDRSAPGFQAALGAAFCSANHPGNPNYTTTAGASGGVQIACDGSDISPVALKILQVKLPNGSYYVPSSPTGDFQRVQYSSPAIYRGDQYIANFDYLISSKHTLQGRYLFTEDPQTVPFGSTVPGQPVNTYYANTDSNLKLTTLVTSTFVNVARAAFQRNLANGTNTPPYSPQSVGITPIVPQVTGPPTFDILNALNIGTGGPYYGPANQWNFSDQISWTRGKHSIRAGAEYETDEWNLSFGALLRGTLFIPTFEDFLLGRPGCTTADCGPANPGNTTGAAFGTFLSCLFCVRSGPQGIIHAYREHDVAGFFQDDWKVSSRLTLNLGVRWEYDGMLGDKNGNLTNIWPSLLQTVPIPPASPQPSGPALVGYVVPGNFISHYGQPPAGVTVVSGNNPTHNGIPHNDLGPRFGFAYQPVPNGKIVLRGGFGLFYDRVGSSDFVHAVEQGDPYALTLDYSGPSALPYSLATPFPSTPLGFTPRWFNPATGANSALNAPFYADVHTPLSRQYNLNVQYQFQPNWVLEVGFVGSSGINQVDYNHDGYNVAQLASPTNPINGVTTNTVANAVFRVPYLGYAPLQLQGTGYDLVYNYNSLQVTLRKRFSYGLTVQAAYTWSKNLTDNNTAATGGIGDGQANMGNPQYPGLQYGPAGFSRPQRVVVSYSYNLPFGNPAGLKGKLVSGWQLAGVMLIQDGSPLTFYDTAGGTVFTGGTQGGTGEAGDSTAQLCPGSTLATIKTPGGIESRLGGAGSTNGYFYPSAFCAPIVVGADGKATAYGNSGLGILLGPGQFNWDTSLIKTTKLTEKQTLQFRAEFFNLLNHPQFGNPAMARNVPSTFGEITTTSTNQRLIQLALKYLF